MPTATGTKEGWLLVDEEMPTLLTILENADEVAIDTETTGLNVRNGVDYLMGVCFAIRGTNGYIPFRHQKNNVMPRWTGPLFEVLSNKPLIWHNRKFDWHSIRTLGIDPRILQGPQYDTLLIATLINEELPSKELDWLAKRFLKSEKYDTDIYKIGEIYGFETIPAEIWAPAGAYDAKLTGQLKEFLWPRLVEQNLQSVYWDTESALSTVLFSMETRGVGVNSDLAMRKSKRGRARMDTIKRHLQFNPASTTDLSHYLLEELKLPVLGRTPKGKPSFRKEVMEQYDDILQQSNNPTAKLVAEYRGWQKAVTSLYDPLLEKVGPDGKIRTNFNQHVAVTGRLSANDPNLQQVPRSTKKSWNGDAKACFTSGREGYLLYGWDYSQIELRLAAAYGREKTLLEEFEKEESDPFTLLTPLIFGTFTDEFRHKTKNCFVYPNLYGAGLPRVSAALGMPVSEARPLYDKYKKSIPGIIEISHQINSVMATQGFVSYWDGRRRHIKKRDEQHKAWNSVIQGGAAQLVKKAILRCEEFADDDCFPVLTVHDEITFCVREEAVPDYEPKIKKAMTDFPEWPVRLAVEGKEWK